MSSSIHSHPISTTKEQCVCVRFQKPQKGSTKETTTEHWSIRQDSLDPHPQRRRRTRRNRRKDPTTHTHTTTQPTSGMTPRRIPPWTRTNSGGNGGVQPNNMQHSIFGRSAWYPVPWRRMTRLLVVVLLCWVPHHPLPIGMAAVPNAAIIRSTITRRNSSVRLPRPSSGVRFSFQAPPQRLLPRGSRRQERPVKQPLLLAQHPPWTTTSKTTTTTTPLFLSSSMSEAPLESTGNATLPKNNQDNPQTSNGLEEHRTNQTVPTDKDDDKSPIPATSATTTPPTTTTTTTPSPPPLQKKQFLRPNDGTSVNRKNRPSPAVVTPNPKPTPLENLHMVNHTPPRKLNRFLQRMWQTWNPRIPNLLTTLRLTVLLPLMLHAFYSGRASWYAAATWWTVGAATDGLDGWWARRFDCRSAWGAFLDPVADKITVCTTLIVLTGYYGTILLALPTAIIVGREIAISALREWMASLSSNKNDTSDDDNPDDPQTKSVVAVSWQGKVKTAVTLVALSAWLLMAGANQRMTMTTAALPSWSSLWLWHVVTSRFWYGWCVTLLYTATLLTVTSGVSYFRAAAPYLGGESSSWTNQDDHDSLSS